MRLGVELIEARLRAPLVSAPGSSRVRPLLLLRLDDGRGHVGYGEAAPLEYYDGVSIDDARAALHDCADVLMAADAGADR